MQQNKYTGTTKNEYLNGVLTWHHTIPFYQLFQFTIVYSIANPIQSNPIQSNPRTTTWRPKLYRGYNQKYFYAGTPIIFKKSNLISILYHMLSYLTTDKFFSTFFFLTFFFRFTYNKYFPYPFAIVAI